MTNIWHVENEDIGDLIFSADLNVNTRNNSLTLNFIIEKSEDEDWDDEEYTILANTIDELHKKINTLNFYYDLSGEGIYIRNGHIPPVVKTWFLT